MASRIAPVPEVYRNLEDVLEEGLQCYADISNTYSFFRIPSSFSSSSLTHWLSRYFTKRPEADDFKHIARELMGRGRDEGIGSSQAPFLPSSHTLSLSTWEGLQELDKLTMARLLPLFDFTLFATNGTDEAEVRVPG